jgi:hypothetical protein
LDRVTLPLRDQWLATTSRTAIEQSSVDNGNFLS